LKKIERGEGSCKPPLKKGGSSGGRFFRRIKEDCMWTIFWGEEKVSFLRKERPDFLFKKS